MAKKRKKVAKKRPTKKTDCDKTTAAEDEKAKIDAITPWLRKVD